MRKIDFVFAVLGGWGVAWVAAEFLKGYGLVLALGLPIFAIFALWVSFLIGRKLLFVFQVAKFLLIGILATLVDLGIFKLLDSLLPGLRFGGLIFKGVSFLVATFAKYWGNKFWAFEKNEKTGMGKEITQFYAVTALGLAVDVGIFSVIVNVVGPQFGLPLDTWKTVGVLAAAIVVSVWNFIGYKFIVFRK